MKKKILIFAIVSVLIVSGIIVLTLINKNKYIQSNFVLDNENKYIVTTNTKWMSMQNDGGSHTNIYYQIDLNEKSIIKCEDKYVGFKGHEYKGKIIFSKKINDIEKNELETILNDAIKNNIYKEENMNFNYYIVSSFNNEDVKIYDTDSIEKIESLIENDLKIK